MIDAQLMVKMIRAAAEKIRANHTHLSALDAAIGDGDHGTTICRVMDAAEKAALAAQAEGLAAPALLDKVGWEVMGVDGGSTSPLLGSWLLGMSEAAADAMDTAATAAMFAGGLANLRTQSKAQVGDKTLMDALIPAGEALDAAAAEGRDAASAMKAAAEAAGAGAERTKEFRARFGRARNLGERVIGHADPGATSISLIFQGFAEALANHKA